MTYEDFKRKALLDPNVLKEYENLREEYENIQKELEKDSESKGVEGVGISN